MVCTPAVPSCDTPGQGPDACKAGCMAVRGRASRGSLGSTRRAGHRRRRWNAAFAPGFNARRLQYFTAFPDGHRPSRTSPRGPGSQTQGPQVIGQEAPARLRHESWMRAEGTGAAYAAPGKVESMNAAGGAPPAVLCSGLCIDHIPACIWHDSSNARHADVRPVAAPMHGPRQLGCYK